VTAIWLLSTRGRPDAAQEVLDACEATGMTSPGVVYVDEDTGLYDKLRVPFNWRIHREPTWGSLQASMQWAYKQYPRATHYGWLADDTVPRTDGWDKELERTAGRYGFAHARDLWHSEDPIDEHEFIRGDDMSAGLCWAGDLVRTVGWWALPGVTQAGIDTAWTAMLGPLGLIRYRRDVIVEHKHYRTGKREIDAGDSWERDGHEYIKQDIWARDAWVMSDDFIDTITRISEVADIRPNWVWLHQSLVNAKAASRFKLGMPGARLQAIIDHFDAEVKELVQKVQRSYADAQPDSVS
jgi:hypothetical protein